MYHFYYDSTYILVVIGALICMLASARVNRTFQRYAKVRNHNRMTGKEAAERILRTSGIHDVSVQRVRL